MSKQRVDTDLLDEIQRRVLWLAVRMVDFANRERELKDDVKVGGHQASSASLTSIMTALYFDHLDGPDRVSVKPHASPVFHAIQYLLGNLDESYLKRLREFGGLQSYPSRTKDPDAPDFSTGSVGLGAAAPLFAAATRRYVDSHFGERPHSRFIALIGDAELDEGNVWEAVADPATTELGNVMWVVDFNRQSLDRVIPGIRIMQWRAQFEAAGWHVIEVKYGKKLQAKFAQPFGKDLEAWIDAMANEQYQSLFGFRGQELRTRFLEGAPAEVGLSVAELNDEELYELVTDLGGHNLDSLRDAFAVCDSVTDRPSVVFAYTIKGWGLPMAGNPRNHSALLSGDQIDNFRSELGLTKENEWSDFEPQSPAGVLSAQRRHDLHRPPTSKGVELNIPAPEIATGTKPLSTQEAFGRVLVDLSRIEEINKYMVTTAPDVATSTNLAGFINRNGIYSPDERRAWNEDPMLKWAEGPTGQHIELGISEMNLFLLLGQLGLSWDLSDQPLIPIGTVYDPFVCRGLDAFIYGTYSAARFIIAGTPSGVTLAPEGGAHQSTITASIGMELPGVTFIEPTYGTALSWMLADAISRVAAGPSELKTAAPYDDGAFYFRLTTRPLDQAPFEAARKRIGDAVLKRQVLSGGYRLFDAFEQFPELRGGDDSERVPMVHLVASGAVMPEVLAAAQELCSEGVAAHVIDVTSADRWYGAWQRTLRQAVRTASAPSLPGPLWSVLGDRAPIVTIQDASSHAMAWMGSAIGVPCVSLGVDSFGQSGTVKDLYNINDLSSGAIVNAALASLALDNR